LSALPNHSELRLRLLSFMRQLTPYQLTLEIIVDVVSNNLLQTFFFL